MAIEAKEGEGALAARREAYYRRIAPDHLAPLWEVIRTLLARAPVSAATPHLWPYARLRPLLLEAGGLITAEEAERRVLVLENPGLTGRSAITETLYAGLQLILPGEIAPAHRHTPAALRFIIEGEGAYTSVDGEKAAMAPGDFVITPSWAWHDHGHEGDAPVVWLDGLDIPLIRHMGPIFAENYGQGRYPVVHPPGHSRMRYGRNMRPVGDDPGDGRARPHSPIFSYPYGATREALAAMAAAEDPDPRRGFAMEYINPLTGGPAMPTLSCFMTLLPAGFAGAPRQTTESQVFSVVEGEGRVLVEEDKGWRAMAWGPKDHFVIPIWTRHRFEAEVESVLFSFTDGGVQRALGVYREG